MADLGLVFSVPVRSSAAPPKANITLAKHIDTNESGHWFSLD